MTTFFVNNVVPGVYDVVTDARTLRFYTTLEFLAWVQSECNYQAADLDDDVNFFDDDDDEPQDKALIAHVRSLGAVMRQV